MGRRKGKTETMNKTTNYEIAEDVRELLSEIAEIDAEAFEFTYGYYPSNASDYTVYEETDFIKLGTAKTAEELEEKVNELIHTKLEGSDEPYNIMYSAKLNRSARRNKELVRDWENAERGYELEEDGSRWLTFISRDDLKEDWLPDGHRWLWAKK